MPRRAKATGSKKEMHLSRKPQRQCAGPKAKPRKARGRKGKRAAAHPSRSHIVMPQHTQDYAAAIIGGARSSDACHIPDGGGFDSVKCKVTTKGVMVTATDGNGWVLLQPAYAMTSDQLAVTYTTTGVTDVTATYYASTLSAAAIAGQVGSAKFPNSQYPNSSFGTGNGTVKGRLVSAELSVLYIGTELNCGGVAFVLCDPQHNSLVQATGTVPGFSYIANNVASGEQAIEMGKPIVCKHNGVVAPNDLLFTTPVAATTSYPYMAVCVSAAGGVQNFEWQADVIYELVGSVVASATPSPEDQKGRHAVDSAMQRTQAKHPDAHATQGFVSSAASEVGKVLGEATHVVGDVASHLPGEELAKGAWDIGSKLLAAF